MKNSFGDPILGKKIKALRLSEKVTPKEFAHSLDISESDLKKIETGESAPSTNVIFALKTKYKVNLNALLAQ